MGSIHTGNIDKKRIAGYNYLYKYSNINAKIFSNKKIWQFSFTDTFAFNFLHSHQKSP